MEKNMTKYAGQTVELFKNKKYAESVSAMGTFGPDYVRTVVQENSFIGALLPEKPISGNTKGVIKTKNVNVMEYREDVEQGAVAMEAGVRGLSAPRFVDGKEYSIYCGKIESEEIIKSRMELETAGSLLEMIKINSKDAIARVQDEIGMRQFRKAIETPFSGIPVRDIDVDWSADGGPSKEGLVTAKNIISGMELKNNRWIMSDIFDNWLDTFEHEQAGPKTSDLLTTGFGKDGLLRLERVVTGKTMLKDSRYEFTGNGTQEGRDFLDNDGEFFDWIVPDDGVYTAVYLMVAPAFLGKAVKFDTDTVWSEWVKDDYKWQTWRYWGCGLGDFRGLVRLVVKLVDLS